MTYNIDTVPESDPDETVLFSENSETVSDDGSFVNDASESNYSSTSIDDITNEEFFKLVEILYEVTQRKCLSQEASIQSETIHLPFQQWRIAIRSKCSSQIRKLSHAIYSFAHAIYRKFFQQ